MSNIYTTSELRTCDIIRIDHLLSQIQNNGLDGKMALYDYLEFLAETEDGKRKNRGYYEVDVEEYGQAKIEY